ncbi:MAG: NAD(P)H-dependent oxidoreductase subunit E [Thermoplasmatota archaeon]
MESSDIDRADTILSGHQRDGSSLIPVLEEVNEEFNYLPRTVLRYVARELDVPYSQAYGVATFYTAFSLNPRGKHTIKVCMGTACHVRGSPKVLEEIERELGIEPGETTSDGMFTLETVNCLGTCALGPVVVLDDEYHMLRPGGFKELLQDFLSGDAEPATPTMEVKE